MDKIKQIIEGLLGKMEIKNPEIDIKKDNSLKEKELLAIDIKINPREAKYFFAENGAGLSSLQHLIRLLTFKSSSESAFVVIDINNYRKEREKILADLAIKAAQKVRRTRKAIILEPMSASERRFIHLKLAEYPDIVTESMGEEPERKIVVRLYP